MAYDLIKISALPAATPDESQEIVVGVGDLAKRINYGDVKADMVGTSPSYTTDTEPYLMRRTAHTGVVGKCALDKLVGGSLGWNQLVENKGQGGTSNGVTATNNNDGTWTFNGTYSYSGQNTFFNLNYYSTTVNTLIPVIKGHKYLTYGNYSETGLAIGFLLSNLDAQGYVNNSATVPLKAPIIFQYTGSQNVTLLWRYQLRESKTFSNVKQWVECIDLTQAFGSTIADYVYGLEQATAGAGVAWLSKYIDLGTYHAYDAGSIQSVQATAHVTTGKNFLTDYVNHESPGVFNGVTFTKNSDGTITLNGTATAATLYYLSGRSVLPDTVGLRLPKGNYILSGTPTGYSSSNLRMGMNRGGSGDTIGNDTGSGFAFTEPEGTAVTYGVWIGFNSGAVFNNVVIKPMVRYADADSTYVPYQKHTYPLGSDTLRGIPQLVSNKLAFDGDEKYSDGTIRRKYGIVDLGSLNWAREATANSGWRFYSIGFNLHKKTGAGVVPNMICPKYNAVTANQTWNNVTGISNNGTNPSLTVCDMAYSDAASFKTAMSGVYLVYELETEATESSTSYQKVQTIDADGTESFTTSTPVPVGHETETPDNILAALGWLGE